MAVAEDWLRRSPYASTVLEQVRDGIRLKRGFGGVSAEQIEQARLLCARLSLSLPAVLSRGGISVQGLRLIGNVLLEPKSVIRHAVSVSDWGNEAFGHLNRSLDTPCPFLIGEMRLSGILPASVRILFLATPSARREACCMTQAGNLPNV